MASAKRGVLGCLPSDDVEEDESVEDFRAVSRLSAAGRFLSSWIAMAMRVETGERGRRNEDPGFC